MKNILVLIISLFYTTVLFSQKNVVQNAYGAFNNAKSADIKNIGVFLKEAKKHIDEAYNFESTSNDAKMWNYRSQIYLKIALSSPELDENAIFKATESYIKCLKIKDPTKKRPKIIVHKLRTKEEVLAELIQCGYHLFTLGVENYSEGNFSQSLLYYDAIFDIIPFDEEDQLKRGNITEETILYNSFFSSNKLKNDKKSKELLQKLIDINFNEPAIYIQMCKIFLNEKDTVNAINYMNQGRDLFEDDKGLINEEINLYINLNKTDDLILKLNSVLENDQENETILNIRGTVYYNLEEYEKSKIDYLKILSFNPNSFDANFILGSIQVNFANNLIDKSNNTTNDKLYQKWRKEAENYFSTALPYLEKAFEIKQNDKNNLELLKQIYYKIGDYKKSDAMKKLILIIK